MECAKVSSLCHRVAASAYPELLDMNIVHKRQTLDSQLASWEPFD